MAGGLGRKSSVFNRPSNDPSPRRRVIDFVEKYEVVQRRSIICKSNMFHRIALLILYLSTGGGVLSFSATPPRRSSGDGSALKAESIDRRSLMTSAAAALIAVGPALSLVSGAPGVANAVETKDALISDLKASLDKIQTVPGLVEVTRGSNGRHLTFSNPKCVNDRPRNGTRSERY